MPTGLSVPLLPLLVNVSFPAAHRRLSAWFEGPASSFSIFVDDACAMPADWRSSWDRPLQWGVTGEKNWATKYGAAGFIPHMIERSPFATSDWRRASASVVVLFARQYAAGPAIAQQQCLQRLRERSEAWRATNGSRHFFIFTDSRGPCCLDGKYKDVGFLNHHIIGPHGEPEEKWFFRRGRGPKVRCFDASKDVNIPTPNIHFPRTPYAPPLSMRNSVLRPLLLFYAGWNYKVRMDLVKLYRNDPDADVMVRREVDPAEYIDRILSAKFCPVCGGFSQWTPRLAEALHYECVPVIMSPQMLPPWSSILDWSTFSVRIDPTRRNLIALKSNLRSLDHSKLLEGVRRAKAALTYHLDGWTGADMLPLLLYEMHRAAARPIPLPLGVRVLHNDISTDRDYDVGMKNIKSQRAHDVFTRATIEVRPGELWECTSKDGYMCSCKHANADSMVEDQPFNSRKRFREPHGRLGGFTSPIAASNLDGIEGRRLAEAPELSCPETKDLEDPAQLDAMLGARASAGRDVVITILGPTSGTRAVRMGDLGHLMLRNMIANLREFGITNYLAITTNLHQPSHPENNLCLSLLQPAGICCAYAGVGMSHVAEGASGRRWGVSETHPYMLFLQRWWLTAQAVSRGYNILSLDTDMRLDRNPLELLRTAPYSGFSALMQLDSAWPVEGRKEGQRSTDERGQHVNVIPCHPQAEGSTSPHGCPCGVAPAPMLNTGFVYVRSSPSSTSAQQMVYNRSVDLILHRLRQESPKLTGKKKEVDPRPVWSQDVVNEVATRWSSLPSGWPASCHIKDIACQPHHTLTASDLTASRRRWWLESSAHSLWLASHSTQCKPPSLNPHGVDQQLVAWTELRPPQELSGWVGGAAPTLAALPRAEVGRMCGKRQAIDSRWLILAPPLPCSVYSSAPLRQSVLHMQFTNAETRIQILKAMHWWHLGSSSSSSGGSSSSRSSSGNPGADLHSGTTCGALANGEVHSTLEGVVVSSAMANVSLLCVVPMTSDSAPEKQAGLARGICPCCWDVSQLRRAMLQASTVTEGATKEMVLALKALKQADKYTRCRIWRRFV